MPARHPNTRSFPALGLLLLACAAPVEPVHTTPSAQSETPASCAAPDVAWAGTCVDPTGGRSATAAVQAAIDALPPAEGLGVVLELPNNARLLLDDPDGDGVALTIDKRVILEGRGARVDIPEQVTGIRLLRNAAWSSIRDLSVHGTGPQHDALGIDVRAHGLRLDNLWFRAIGRAIEARSTFRGASCESDDDCVEGSCAESSCLVSANVNSQMWSRIVIQRSGSGVVLEGRDANGGLLEGVEVLSTPRGIEDHSLLGNVYVAPLTEGTRELSIDVSRRSAYSTVVGGYIERGDPPAQTAARSLFVGGNAASYTEGLGERVGMGASRLRFRDMNTRLQVTIPSGSAAMTWRHPDDASGSSLRRFGGTEGRWGFATPAGRVFLSPQTPLMAPQITTTPEVAAPRTTTPGTSVPSPSNARP